MSENSIGRYYEQIDHAGGLWRASWYEHTDNPGVGHWFCQAPIGEIIEHDHTTLTAIANSAWREKQNLHSLVFSLCGECDAYCVGDDYLCSTCRSAQDQVESER